MVITKDLGAVSAYAYAVEQGYQGTEEEFAELMARQATVAEEAAASADAAAESANEAQASAEQAEQSAQSISGDVERAEQAATTATNKATEAATSATTANGAAQTATGKAAQAEQSATAAANSASAAATSASNAAASATAAQTAKTAAETAQDKAEDAQAAAEAAAQSVSESAAQIAQNTANFASEFSASTTYAIGDYCVYNGSLYKAINVHTGAWNAADFERVTVAGEVSNLESQLDEYVLSKYDTVEPSNWFNPNAITDGELLANGTVTESTTRFYTDFIPVTGESSIRGYRSNPINPVYRRHITVYDSNKNVIQGVGSDSSSLSFYNLALLESAQNAAFVRITFDKNILDLSPIIVTDGSTPTTYSAYFEPYDIIIEDFLTPESKAALQGVKDETAAYGYAIPMGSDIRLTVGIPEKWYYKSMLTPDILTTNLGLGVQYSQRENDGVSIPNTESLNSSNGYSFTVYNQNLQTVFSYAPNGGYGSPRKIIAEDLQNCSALVIGDSTVDFDTMTQYMLDYFTSKSKTLTLLGTLGSGDNKNEGRAGWKATDYLTNKTYDGVVNPFYNPSSETFDFAYYMTNQGYSAPDFVVLQLGINDLYNSGIAAIEPTWNAIKTMIDSIIAYNSSIHVLLNLPTTPNSDQSKHNVFLPLYQNRVVRYNQYAMGQAMAIYGTSKVRPTYCHLILDPATDIRDNVHPTNAGFEKMAKEVINQINCWQNGV